MIHYSKERGSHVIALSIALFVMALALFAGMRVMQTAHNRTPSIRQTVAQPQAIKNRTDLVQASQSVQSAKGDVNADMNANQLTPYINGML
jgi:hypothetical protein